MRRLSADQPAPVASPARPVGTHGKAANPSADDRCRPTAPTRRDAPGNPDGPASRAIPRPERTRQTSASSGSGAGGRDYGDPGHRVSVRGMVSGNRADEPIEIVGLHQAPAVQQDVRTWAR